jgi:hypothetical protein
MQNKFNPWTILNTAAGIAVLAMALTGCDTNRSDRSVTDTRDSSVDTSRTNDQQPGTAPTPSSMDNSSSGTTSGNGH